MRCYIQYYWLTYLLPACDVVVVGGPGSCLSIVILAEGVGEDTEVEAEVGLDSKAETEWDKADSYKIF